MSIGHSALLHREHDLIICGEQTCCDDGGRTRDADAGPVRELRNRRPTRLAETCQDGITGSYRRR